MVSFNVGETGLIETLLIDPCEKETKEIKINNKVIFFIILNLKYHI